MSGTWPSKVRFACSILGPSRGHQTDLPDFQVWRAGRAFHFRPRLRALPSLVSGFETLDGKALRLPLGSQQGGDGIDAVFRRKVSDVCTAHYLWAERTVSGRSPRRISARLLNSPSGYLSR